MTRALGTVGLAVLAAWVVAHVLYIGPVEAALEATVVWIVVFVVAWIAQFIGHKVEGRRPSFLTDLTYLLVGPAWLISKVYRRLGWRY